MTTHKNLMTLCVAAVLTLGLAACGGDGGDDPVTEMPDPTPPPDPGPTAYEAAKAAIAAATTAEAAQAAYDAALGDVTGAEAAQLLTALNDRIAELATMARAAEQRMALMTAAGMIDTSDLMTAEDIAAANTAIAALKGALAAATDVSDADKAVFQGQVTAAETAVTAAQRVLDHAAQTMELTGAVAALRAIDLGDLSTQDKIDAAETAIAALQTALDDATELSDAEKATAMTELATANRTVMMAQDRVDRSDQMTMLSEALTALRMINLDDLMTQDKIDEAYKAIAAVQAALNAATDLTDAEKLDATVDVTVANRKLEAARTDLADNIEGQKDALTMAGTALGAINLDDLDTAEKIAAAKEAVEALEMALEGATHLSDAEKEKYQTQHDTAEETVTTAETGMNRDQRRTAQMEGLTTADAALTTALNALSGTEAPTQEQIDAAETAFAALTTAIEEAEDLTEAEKSNAMRALAVAEGRIAGAKQARMVADNAAQKAKEEEERKAREAMAVTATKLYAGIAAPMGDANSPAATDRAAAYNDAGTPTDSAVDTHILVSIGNGTDVPTAVALSEDKKTTVPDLHGWEGKRYTAEPTDDGTYEAVVYSNVGEPTEGDPFNEEYTLNAADAANPGELPITGDQATATARIASSSFDQSAGTKEFELGTNQQRVVITGSYHGVSGTYYCTPAAASTCAAQVAAEGFTLGGTADADNAFTTGGGTWTFKPSTATAKVMSAPDTVYRSYGWWIHMSEDGGTYTASVFVDEKGSVPAAAALDSLQGTATYRGGAAGKYALSSSTGGTNDAGHFTARATLEADFSDNSITGTVDQFMGADGESRDWSLELKEAAVAPTGGITRAADNDTVWTIGDSPADASGEWSGSLYDNGDDGVPKVGTGTFYSTYGNAGKMVGAFGANKQ